MIEKEKETIYDLCMASGMTHEEFGNFLGIPKKSIDNWCIERTKCPQYVIDLASYKLRKENKLKYKIESRK